MKERDLFAASQPSMLQYILGAARRTAEEAEAAEDEWVANQLPLIYPGYEKCPLCPTLINRAMTNRVYCRFCVSKLKKARGFQTFERPYVESALHGSTQKTYLIGLSPSDAGGQSRE